MHRSSENTTSFIAKRLADTDVVLAVNAHVLTAKELEDRAVTLLEDDRRQGRKIALSPQEALAERRMIAARMWVYHQIMLDDALAKGIKVSAAEAEEAEKATERALMRSHGITLEQYLKQGPLDEKTKLADIRDAQLIRKLLLQEVDRFISLTNAEIDEYMAESGLSRKDALAKLRRKKYDEGTREYFRKPFPLAHVRSDKYPSLEIFEGVSPDGK